MFSLSMSFFLFRQTCPNTYRKATQQEKEIQIELREGLEQSFWEQSSQAEDFFLHRRKDIISIRDTKEN